MINDANIEGYLSITKRLAEYVNQPSKTIFAYTQTFTATHLKTPKGQFKETVVHLTKLLARSTAFILVPEWRATNGSIHYHGILIIKDRIKWLKQTLPSLRTLGYVLIKPIDNMQKWIEYFTKEMYIASGIIDLQMPICEQVVICQNKCKEKTNDTDTFHEL